MGGGNKMNSPALGLRVAGIIFAFMALAHLWRVVRGSAFVVGRFGEIPMSVSVVGALVAGALAVWMLWLASKARNR